MDFVKIGIFSDVHGNLEALKKVFEVFENEGCSEIFNLGDTVSLGGYSKQCLDFVLSKKNCTNLLGNHDKDYVDNTYQQKPLSHTTTAHKLAVFDQLGDDYRQKVSQFKLYVEKDYFGLKVAFMHYALTGNPDWPFQNLATTPSGEQFDQMFKFCPCDLIFFGHKHELCNVVGKTTKVYCDVGSAGCHPRDTAECVVLTIFENKGYQLSRVAVPYDRLDNLKQMQRLNMPDSEYLFDFYYNRKDV
ncbi:MAG: metallophosphoesterase family protein [Clostridia bacterium]|nr:metallophosphoesterase family protein [Clostridia bacterium]